MNSLRIVIGAGLLAAAALQAGTHTEYMAYRASMKSSVAFEQVDPGTWENHAGKYGSLVLVDVSIEEKDSVVNRMAVVTFWVQPQGRYYTVETLTSGAYFYELGNGTGALVVAGWGGKAAKPVPTGTELAVLLCKVGDGPVKSLKGTCMTLMPDAMITRAEASLKLDSALGHAAATAASGSPGDPFGAATAVLVTAVQAMGYTPVP